MHLCVVGTGYVGLVSGACLADVGNTVWCVDRDEAKVARLARHEIPIYEPGLEEAVRRNEDEGRLFFTASLAEGLGGAEVCFITVDTPPGGDGHADLTNVLAVARALGSLIARPLLVVTKSTVPVGTTALVKQTISEGLRARGLDPTALLAVASNPEFLKEGAAIEDFMKPDRVIVGVEDESAAAVLHELYLPFMRRQDRFLRMEIPSAELAKYAANAMLATRISFMNELARLCEKVDADIADIKRALGADPRIGPDFLYAGLGFGGSCFPKDTKAIVGLGKERGVRLTVMEAVDAANDAQREWFWEKIAAHFGGTETLRGKRFALWGVAFKANTDDIRFAPSLSLMRHLLDAGAFVSAFDPAAMATGRAAMGERSADVRWGTGAYDVVEGADALIICTEWREFRSPDFARLKALMKAPVIFDGRNLYEPDAVRRHGFAHIAVGRPTSVTGDQ